MKPVYTLFLLLVGVGTAAGEEGDSSVICYVGEDQGLLTPYRTKLCDSGVTSCFGPKKGDHQFKEYGCGECPSDAPKEICAPCKGLSYAACNTPPKNCVERMGCWKDEEKRAISGRMTTVDKYYAVRDCKQHATKMGFTVFGLEVQNECFTSADAHNTYDKYGYATNCGPYHTGDDWALSVYKRVVCTDVLCLKEQRYSTLDYDRDFEREQLKWSHGNIMMLNTLLLPLLLALWVF